MIYKRIKTSTISIIIILCFLLLLFLLPSWLAKLYATNRTYTAANAPAGRVAIIFGAGLWHNGSPSPVLSDRVAVGAKLYFSGKVEKLLLSGDNRFVDYNEPGAMRTYALTLGVPEDALILDFAGRRSYDTCYRARHIFGLHSAILVSQSFHLPRAVFLCNKLGISSIGVNADLRDYHQASLIYWNLREIPATAVAFWELYVTHPLPVLGKYEPIFPEEKP